MRALHGQLLLHLAFFSPCAHERTIGNKKNRSLEVGNEISELGTRIIRRQVRDPIGCDFWPKFSKSEDGNRIKNYWSCSSSKVIPNTPCYLVSVALNILSRKKKYDVTRELIRTEVKRWKNHFSCKKPSLHKNQKYVDKRREKRGDWMII